jgi:quercetin dioxygenase-like cupin family protein
MKHTVAALLVMLTGSFVAPRAQAAGKAVFVPASSLKWSDVPGMQGIQVAAVDGDPAKGPSHFFLKFTAGFSAPLHHHSANHSGTVVAGTMVLTVDGKEEKLPAGSFFSFSGKQPHMTKCEAGADCILSMDVRGKWDVVPAKDAAKK